ncbi:UPF0158 family protein [Arthrobacter sp. FW306-06-A]|uniref:UPF0158 family protein n=1 Tax=Arthrobacter sp. FW306-06-A TaxID=2879621 RepID=UPI001F4555EB|nr:UPF0158 family protein [Arthrobacter sp. FW306-06-A]UKA73324.1 UPF0158 family protein [Arthrobacter sp. FW306-06-A]
MARTWLSVTVELLGGRGEELWPWPGRVFAVGPSHTFMDLANAINDAFARWDRSHLSMFTLDDGRLITDEETGAEMAGSISGPIIAPINIATAKVARTLEPGAEFKFMFDLGDAWTHRCVLGEVKIDPLEVLGIRPDAPLPYWGWGRIPDQYGRRWATDDGESRVPSKPSEPHPMLLHAWPAQVQVPGLDLPELRQAIAAADAARLLAAVTGRDIDDTLQQVGAGIPMALKQQRQEAEPVALSVINRLTQRGCAGDQALAEDLLASLRRVPLTGRAVPVDLDMLSIILEGDPDLSTGGYLDLHTGQVYDEAATDPMIVGQDNAIDVEDESDRWLRLNRTGSGNGWQDMAAFAGRQHDETLRERLERAIEGKGAFSRFRGIVHDENLSENWYAFSTDRQMGRAREVLADNGIRVG